ncbi:hypothetical protein SFC66_09960 [Terribacillus saccharophilus]|uniref:hypothetical protein n=1 Tax=Terribacillus saccharophilus TaxID=361277 RepID=UPI00398202F9
MQHPSIQMSQGILPALQSQLQSQNNLQAGQIVTGKIAKFFPDNKALLQIGAKQIIAELQTSLSAGSAYWFEVKEGGERPRLQVLPQAAGKQPDVNQLIELTGHKPSKMNTSFVDGLSKQQTPFSMPQLKQALDLLQLDPRSFEVHKEALQVMLDRKLPLSENVLQAIAARQTQDLTSSLRQLTATITTQNNNPPLQQTLTSVSPEGPAVNEGQLIQQIIQEAKMGKQGLYQAIRPSLLPNAPSYEEWQQQWNDFGKQSTVAGNPQEGINRISDKTAGVLPFGQAFESFKADLQEVGKQPVLVQERLQTSLSTAQQLLSMFPDRALPEEITANLRNSMEAFRSVPVVRDIDQLLQNTSTNKEQLLAKTSDLSQLLQISQQNEQSKDGAFFRQLMQDILRQTGFAYEHDLLDTNAEDTLKGVLLQHTAQGHEKADLPAQLLQQITGSQLLQVHDDKQMLHIQLQLPGAPFGFDKDILMEMEGKKEEDGQLSADHCRILFYLHLPNLKDVAIDMYVQKKTINLHIYTTAEEAEQVMRPLQEKLKSALDSNGYHLSAVKFSASDTVKERNGTKLDYAAVHPEQKGVDYRI